MGEYGESMPLLIGGGSTTYFVGISIQHRYENFGAWRLLWRSCGLVVRVRGSFTVYVIRLACDVYRLLALLIFRWA